MANVRNITFDQGANVSISITLKDNTNTGIDLTGYTANASYKKHANAYANTIKTFTTAGYANGLLVLSMTAEESTNTDWGRFLYDVTITEISSNTSTRVQEGILTIKPRIT